MHRISGVVVWIALAGCGGSASDCEEADKVYVYVDADSDGFGLEEIGLACGTGPGETVAAGDCDDANGAINPDALELCDELDNDCNGFPDDELEVRRWYADADDDGFGDLGDEGLLDCNQPVGHVLDRTDCDDRDATINPDQDEVCDDGDDEDCDGLIDDEDDLDQDLLPLWYRDADQDGFGNDAFSTPSCKEPPGPPSSSVGGDCNDDDRDQNPDATEVCNRQDDDCDTFVDDDDPDIDPNLLSDFFSDADGDGFGDASTVATRCFAGPGAVDNDLDCDDNNAQVTIEQNWYDDTDGDGVGGGAVLSFSCLSPGGGALPASAGIDCNDSNPFQFPGFPEVCEDLIDQDCSGADAPCGPIGQFQITQGPAWTNDPPVVSCLQACALLFGGLETEYSCSTNANNVNHMAFLDGYADDQYCFTPREEWFRREDPNNLGYDCGAVGCSYSAYVTDHGCTSVNYCFAAVP